MTTKEQILQVLVDNKTQCHLMFDDGQLLGMGNVTKRLDLNNVPLYDIDSINGDSFVFRATEVSKIRFNTTLVTIFIW